MTKGIPNWTRKEKREFSEVEYTSANYSTSSDYPFRRSRRYKWKHLKRMIKNLIQSRISVYPSKCGISPTTRFISNIKYQLRLFKRTHRDMRFVCGKDNFQKPPDQMRSRLRRRWRTKGEWMKWRKSKGDQKKFRKSSSEMEMKLEIKIQSKWIKRW